MSEKRLYPYPDEAIFDGELEGELDGASFASLDELGRAVRADFDGMFDEADAASVLSGVHRAIGVARPRIPSGMVSAVNRGRDGSAGVSRHQKVVRNGSWGGVRRWLPAAVAAVLFACSVPGWISIVSGRGASWSDNAEYALGSVVGPAPEAGGAPVYVAGHPACQPVVQSAGTDAGVVLPSARSQAGLGGYEGIAPEDRLTVEEMDTALRFIIRRIEVLEEANRRGVEHGDNPLDIASGDGGLKL